MAAHTVAVFDWTNHSQTEIQNRLRNSPTDKRASLHKLLKFAYSLMTGQFKGTFRVQHCASASARASQTVAVTQASIVATTDALTTLGVTITAANTAANENQFTIGASDSAAATNLGAAINAHSTLKKYVVASVATNVVTVRFLMPGAVCNLFALSEAGNGLVLGAATYAGGAGMDYQTVDAFTW